METNIDIEKWSRKEHFNNFYNFPNPLIGMCRNLSINKLYQNIRSINKSFYLTMIYLVSKTLNKLDYFRVRIKNDNVVKYNIINPYFSYLYEDDSLYFNICVTYNDDYSIFYNNASKCGKNNRLELSDSLKLNVIYILFSYENTVASY